ncbi:MAG: hypothetical protein NC489_38380 [Ruminococcus flavefaciens]|nr:hypothetical protein [Ruminococcus flavefaciens]
MAITPLKTNFKDDILDTSISDKREYNLITNSNGTTSLDDVSVYKQVGDVYGAEQINEEHRAINELINMTSNIDNTPDANKSVSYTERAGTATVANSANTAGTADTAKVADEVKNDFILINQKALTFTQNVCTINDGRITANSLADVYFTSDSILSAEKAVISVETYDGSVQLTAGRTPESQLKASIRIRVVA